MGKVYIAMKKGDIMADILVKGEVANTAASLSAGSTLMVDALQRDEESTLTAVASASQTQYEDFSKAGKQA